MIVDALRGQKRTPVCLLSFYLGNFADIKKGLNPEGAPWVLTMSEYKYLGPMTAKNLSAENLL